MVCHNCGNPLNPDSQFCPRCGAPRAQLPPEFERVENAFLGLKGQLEAGRITQAQFEAALRDLMVQDAQGRWWMIGAESGKWHVNVQGSWSEAPPPTLGAPGIPNPSAPPPTAVAPGTPSLAATPSPPPNRTPPWLLPLMAGLGAFLAVLVLGGLALWLGILRIGPEATALLTPTAAAPAVSQATAVPTTTSLPSFTSSPLPPVIPPTVTPPPSATATEWTVTPPPSPSGTATSPATVTPPSGTAALPASILTVTPPLILSATPAPSATPTPTTAVLTDLAPPTETMTLVPPTTAPPTGTPPPPTLVSSATPTFTPNPPTPTSSATRTHTPVPPSVTPSPTASFTPVPPTATPTVTPTVTAVLPTATPTVTRTSTPSAPPGVYVTNIRIDPAEPRYGQDMVFIVTFLNTTGGPQNYRWFAEIWDPDNMRNAFGETSSRDSRTVPPGSNEVPTSAYSLRGGACKPLMVRAVFLDGSNARVPFRQPNGQDYWRGFQVCP